MKDIIGRLGNYSISLVVRQALLNWGYELVNNYWVKKILQNIKLKVEKFWEKMQKISIETYWRRKRNKKQNMGEIDKATWQKMKKQTKRIPKKIPSTNKK